MAAAHAVFFWPFSGTSAASSQGGGGRGDRRVVIIWFLLWDCPAALASRLGAAAQSRTAGRIRQVLCSHTTAGCLLPLPSRGVSTVFHSLTVTVTLIKHAYSRSIRSCSTVHRARSGNEFPFLAFSFQKSNSLNPCAIPCSSSRESYCARAVGRAQRCRSVTESVRAYCCYYDDDGVVIDNATRLRVRMERGNGEKPPKAPALCNVR
jgi:hypothetical protein